MQVKYSKRRWVLGLLLLCCMGVLLSHCMGAVSSISEEKKGYIVLLHGIARSSDSMREIEEKLTVEGYTVFNIDYPSREKNIVELATWLNTELEKKSLDYFRSLHFVTHSMGGLVAHEYINKYRPKNLGRVVMLAPPNQGSEVADLLKDNAIYKSFYGSAGQELGTDIVVKKVDFELGVIAGDRSIDPISSFIIDGKDDGKVAIKSTKINGMKYHITIHATHTFIMKNDEVIQQVIHFLDKGKFRREDE